jgi:diacylglycerol O-acyltransferase / wax synthase
MERFMRESDAFSWYMENDPVLRSTVVAVMWLDCSPDWSELFAKVERATRVLPSFRQRVVETPARLATPRWTVDPEFDLGWHLRRVNAPDPRTAEEVIDLARVEAMAGFDRARPLWRFTLVEGLDGGGAALVMKIHHALTDGVGGMELALTLFDQDRDAPVGAMPAPPRGEDPGLAKVLSENAAWTLDRSMRFVARHARDAVPGTLRVARRPFRSSRSTMNVAYSIVRAVAPVIKTMSPVMTRRGRGRHLALIEMDLDDLRSSAKVAGGSVNDAFIAAVAGGLRLYHQHHGAPVEKLRMVMPINLRVPGDPLGGNRITLLRFPVPVGETDLATRIQEIHGRSYAARHDGSLPYTNAIAGALNLLPSAAIGGMLKRVDFETSNVPGFTEPVYLTGAKVERYAAFGPTTGTAVNVTLLSYCGTCCAGVNIDTAAVPDPDLLTRCLGEGFAEVIG